MKHLRLFESFQEISKINSLISASQREDRKMATYDLTLDTTDPEIPFLVWNNPEEDEDWRSSGYADDYEESGLDEVRPMYVLAFTEIFGKLFAYMLTPEEKTSGRIILNDIDVEPDQLVQLNTPQDLKEAFERSLWEMG